MPIQLTDTFGPAILKAITDLAKNLNQATQKNAFYIHTQWITGIKSQSLKNNPVQSWLDLSPKYKRSKKKQAGSDLTNILKGTYVNNIKVQQVGNQEYHVGTNVNSKGYYYPIKLEKGSKSKTGRGGNQPARPSLTPVLIMSKEYVLETYKDALAKTFQ